MATIMIQPQELRGKAAQIESCRQQQEDLMRQMRILVNSLREIWTGAAQEAFVANFERHNDTIVEFSETIQDYADLAKEAADLMESKDQELLSLIRNIGI